MPEFDLAKELGRKMPFSAEAEQSVLGSVLIDPDCFNRLTGMLTEDDFYLEEHRLLFAAMQNLFTESRDIDPVTLIDAAVRESAREAALAAGQHRDYRPIDSEEAERYVRLIAEIVPTAANAMEYARIVRDHSRLRRLINVCGEITDDAFAQNDRPDVILGKAEQLIFELSQGRDNREFAHIRDVLHSTLGTLKFIQAEGVNAGTIQTGFSSVDHKLVGMGLSDLIILGARPGMGKTSLALNIATQVARGFANRAENSDKAVCIFSLEMSNEQLATRILSSEAMVDSRTLRSGRFSDDDWKKLADASVLLSRCNIYLDDSAGITVSNMKSKLRRLASSRNKPGFIVVDYLQLMDSDKRIDNPVQKISDITRNLKALAKEFGAPVLCLSQLSRGPEEKGKGRRPVLSDLRDSGSIEQDADIVLLLYREGYYNDTPETRTTVEVNVAKNRHGDTGSVQMTWIGEYTKFVVTEDRED